MSFSFVMSLPLTRNALIWEEECWALKSLQTFSHQFQLQGKASLLCQFQADSKIYAESSDNLCVLTDSYHVQYYCQQTDLASSSQKQFCTESVRL